MSMAPLPKPSIGSTLALGFVNPNTGEFISTASIKVLPNGMIEFRAIQDIPKGSVGCLPMGFIPSPMPPQQRQGSTYTSFDSQQ